jgi:hypothetical protein
MNKIRKYIVKGKEIFILNSSVESLFLSLGRCQSIAQCGWPGIGTSFKFQLWRSRL